MDQKKKEDFYLMPWEKYQNIVDNLTESISEYMSHHGIKFDFLIPILRGGGVLSVSLSHRLGVFRMLPVQYKYMHSDSSDSDYKPYEWLFAPSILDDKEKEYNILVTEGNHCTGQTAQMCINKIKEMLPNSKIYYASVGRDYSFIEKLEHTECEWWGCFTNESEALSQEDCDRLLIINKFIVYPWERIDEELEEVNASMIYHSKTE